MDSLASHVVLLLLQAPALWRLALVCLEWSVKLVPGLILRGSRPLARVSMGEHVLFFVLFSHACLCVSFSMEILIFCVRACHCSAISKLALLAYLLKLF